MALAGEEASRGGCVPGWWPAAWRGGFRRADRGVGSRQALWWGCRSLDSPGRVSRRPDWAHHRARCANKAGRGRWFKTPIRSTRNLSPSVCSKAA